MRVEQHGLFDKPAYQPNFQAWVNARGSRGPNWEFTAWIARMKALCRVERPDIVRADGILLDKDVFTQFLQERGDRWATN